MDESLRVVIADDHPYYREGLARLLRNNGIEVVGEAPNGEAAIRSTLLSGRELEVLSRLADGQTDDQIAKALSMTVSAVRDHAADIIKKLQLEGGVPSPMPATTSPESEHRSGPEPSETRARTRTLSRFWPRGRGLRRTA